MRTVRQVDDKLKRRYNYGSTE